MSPFYIAAMAVFGVVAAFIALAWIYAISVVVRHWLLQRRLERMTPQERAAYYCAQISEKLRRGGR